MVDERMGPSDEAALTAEDKYSIKVSSQHEGLIKSVAFPLIIIAQYKQSSHKPSTQEFDRVRLKQDLTGTHLVRYFSRLISM